jgi:excisionase family DNA binding protein
MTAEARRLALVASLAELSALPRIDEVARVTGFCRKTVSGWIAAGDLLAVRSTRMRQGHVRIPKAALIDFLAARCA